MLKAKIKNSKNLIKVLSTADNIIKRNKANNELQYIRLENTNNKLCIKAKNSCMKLNYLVEDTLSIEGDNALYEYKTFISLLNVLDEEIEINNGVIKNKKCNYKLPLIDSSDYPEEIIQTLDKKEIDTLNIKEAIDSVINAASKNEYDVCLSGIYLNDDKVVACDNNRIFISELNKQLGKVILPKDFVYEVIRLPFQDKIYISYFRNDVILEDENITLISSIIDKPYPKYEGLIPSDSINEFIFKKNDMQQALNLIMPVINDRTYKCKLELIVDRMEISAENEGKKAKTVIPIKAREIDYKPLSLQFNIVYLQDMLKANGEEIAIIQHNAPGYTFKSENNKQYIMPMIN